MKPKIAAQSGTFESSDVIFLIEPLPDNSGRKLEISSTVMQQYGSSFNRIVTEMLDEYQMTDIHLIAKDKGALEPTIKAATKRPSAHVKIIRACFSKNA